MLSCLTRRDHTCQYHMKIHHYFAVGLISVLFTGCGSNEPTVIPPGEDYQLTEQERRNAERAAAEAEKGDPFLDPTR